MLACGRADHLLRVCWLHPRCKVRDPAKRDVLGQGNQGELTRYTLVPGTASASTRVMRLVDLEGRVTLGAELPTFNQVVCPASIWPLAFFLFFLFFDLYAETFVYFMLLLLRRRRQLSEPSFAMTCLLARVCFESKTCFVVTLINS